VDHELGPENTGHPFALLLLEHAGRRRPCQEHRLQVPGRFPQQHAAFDQSQLGKKTLVAVDRPPQAIAVELARVLAGQPLYPRIKIGEDAIEIEKNLQLRMMWDLNACLPVFPVPAGTGCAAREDDSGGWPDSPSP